MSGEPKSVAETRRTRPDVPAPTTVEQFLAAYAQRGGRIR